MTNYTSQPLNIYINNIGNVNLYYCYNNNTTFEDLLEFVSFSYPTYNICHCFQFKNYYNQMIKNEDNFYSYYQNYGNNQLYLTNDKNSCTCNQTLKESLKKRKIEIISENLDKINKLNTEIEKLKKENEILKRKNK